MKAADVNMRSPVGHDSWAGRRSSSSTRISAAPDQGSRAPGLKGLIATVGQGRVGA